MRSYCEIYIGDHLFFSVQFRHMEYDDGHQPAVDAVGRGAGRTSGRSAAHRRHGYRLPLYGLPQPAGVHALRVRRARRLSRSLPAAVGSRRTGRSVKKNELNNKTDSQNSTRVAIDSKLTKKFGCFHKEIVFVGVERFRWIFRWWPSFFRPSACWVPASSTGCSCRISSSTRSNYSTVNTFLSWKNYAIKNSRTESQMKTMSTQ